VSVQIQQLDSIRNFRHWHQSMASAACVI
jgi:hypothetical protein